MSFERPETMTFVNTSQDTVSLDSIGYHIPIAPGDEVEIPFAIAAPTRKDNGTRGKSPIEMIAPQLTPKHSEDAKVWGKVPPLPTPVSRVVTVAPRHAAEAPGIAALRAARVAAETAKPATKTAK